MNTFCTYWIDTPFSWSRSDWTWAECELIQEICIKWGTAGAWWKNSSWRWVECSGSVTPPIPPTGSVVSSGSLQPLGVDATTLIQPWLVEPWNPYRAADELDKKRKRLIKLICKIKGKTYEEEKEVGTMDISVDDIKMVVKEIANIDLNVNVEDK